MGRKAKGGGKKGGKGRSISNVKKANLKRHKLVKAGKLKPKSTPRFVEGGHLKGKSTKKNTNLLKPEELEERERIRKEEAKQWEKEAYAEMGEMMDPEDLAYLRQMHMKKKSGGGDDEDEVDNFELKAMQRHKAKADQEEFESKSTRPLLPIRTKDGKWISRSQQLEVNGDGEKVDVDTQANGGGEDESEDSEDEDSDEDKAVPAKPVSVVEILARRRAMLNEVKIQIGTMATSFLELPEERMHILQKLIGMIGNQEKKKEKGIDPSIQMTVSKLASATLLEIFKDIVPNYKIGDHEEKDKAVKLKKDTLKLHKFESSLVTCVKNFLVKMSKSVRTADTVTDLSKASYVSGKYSLQCICELLIAHPNFNFTSDIIQFLVPHLNCRHEEFRTLVGNSLETVFRNDKRGEVSYLIVRQINSYIKTKKNHQKIHVDLLMPLLSIKLYHLNNDQLTEDKEVSSATSELIKNRKLAKGLSKSKRHLVQPILSKKEKKRAKERARLDRELLEAKGEESTKTRLRFATDITNILFAIYFRLLKSFTSTHAAGSKLNVRLLHPVLNGLAKFGHLMSIEYFQDVLAAFKVIMDNDFGATISNYEKLLCLKTVFAILSGQGDNLTLDPAKFYTILSQIILQLNLNDDFIFSTLKDREYFSKSRQAALALSVLRDAIVVRRKKVAKSTVAPILKNVSMSMLQSSAEASLASVKFLQECLFVAHPQMAPLLVHEGEAEEDGVIIPTAALNMLTNKEDDPFGLANGQALMWEMSTMADHVSPEVSQAIADLLAKKGAKPRRRPAPLTMPIETDEMEVDNVEFDEENESSCFRILHPDLPPTSVTSNKRKRFK